MSLDPMPLPIDSILPAISRELAAAAIVIVEAPPGSGKTLRVAPHLCEVNIGGGRIVLVQPRRVAARAAATRIAEERGWKLGGRVGYQVRFESQITRDTQLLVATDGVLLRQLQSNPFLEGISHVILDEFHERSVNLDLLLGMLRRLQQTVRADLKIVLMSATLAAIGLQNQLGYAPIVRAEGRLFPVETRYRPPKIQQRWLENVVEAIHSATDRPESGDVLVFLPGMGEIGRVQRDLAAISHLRSWQVLPLHGSLPLEDQTRALFAGPTPRIVLATNVAETSLTLEGIRTVIDSGLARVLRFDPTVGLDRLELEPISQASAEQRAGRAGRLGPGTCIRLWDAAANRSRKNFVEPEINRVDLSGAVLQLIAWGEKPDQFLWLDPPTDHALDAALNQLQSLGAISGSMLTELGKVLVRLPVAPRLARLLVAGHEVGVLDAATLAAAMLSEREPFIRATASSSERGQRTTQASRWNCDVTERVAALREFFSRGVESTPFGTIHGNAAQAIRDTAAQLRDQVVSELGQPPLVTPASDALAQCLLNAFPDRLARRRGPNDARGLMVGGRGVKLANSSGVTQPDLFLCIDVDGAGNEALVRQASGIAIDSLPIDHVVEREESFFHPTQRQVVARRRTYWFDLVLTEHPAAITDTQQCARVLFQNAVKQLPEVLPRDPRDLDFFRNRVNCLKEWAPELGLPLIDDDFLQSVLEELCKGRRSFVELQSAPWLDWIKGRFSVEQLRSIDCEAPEKIEVPSGNRLRIEYAVGKPPVLAVRIQEVFSWKATPRIAFGRIPVLLHLLAPNFRPQQVTDDLASFWANTYPLVKKELKRRYPKHAWPDDPLLSAPSAKGRPQR